MNKFLGVKKSLVLVVIKHLSPNDYSWIGNQFRQRGHAGVEFIALPTGYDQSFSYVYVVHLLQHYAVHVWVSDEFLIPITPPKCNENTCESK